MLDLNKLEHLINVTRNGLLVIHLPSREAYDDMMVNLGKLGYRWGGGQSTVRRDNYSGAMNYCIRITKSTKSIVRGIKETYSNMGYKIQEYQDLLKKEDGKIMLENLKNQIELTKEKQENFLAIKVDTYDKWKTVLGLLEKLNYKWFSGVGLKKGDYHWKDYGKDTYLFINVNTEPFHYVTYGTNCSDVRGRVINYEDLIREERAEEEKMNFNATNNLREWAYTRDNIGMTNLANYIYHAFAKKFAKTYKEQYQTEQGQKMIENTVYNAFRRAHQNGNFYRTQAKLVVMNKVSLDMRSWLNKLNLEPCFISNGLYFRNYLTSRNIDNNIKYVNIDYIKKFDEMYFYCDKCSCYHDRTKTSLVKVYNYKTETVGTTCNKAMDDYRLIDGVYYPTTLIKNDGTIAKHKVHSYHSFNWGQPNAQAKSLGDNDNSLKMGIEIETYGDPTNSVFVNKYDNHFHCENDGSLASGNSFEIISVPMTKNYWDSIRNTIINPLFKTLRDNGQTNGNNGYGLHVHIDSKAFKNLDSVKWFIHNVQLHQRLIQKVARRNSSHYYDYQTNDGVYAVEELDISKLQQQFSSHGTCVNAHIWNKEIGGTVEIRVFKSTLDSETLYSTLKLVENLVRLANEHSTSRRELLRGLKDYAIRQHIVIE